MLAAWTTWSLAYQPMARLTATSVAWHPSVWRVSSAPRANFNLLDEERSWSSPLWAWGHPEGESAEAAKAMRMEFGFKSTNSGVHRRYFLSLLEDEGVVDESMWMDVKLLLTMCCERVIKAEEDKGECGSNVLMRCSSLSCACPSSTHAVLNAHGAQLTGRAFERI